MSSTIRMGLLIVAVIAAAVLFSSTFVVPQTAQALVFQFGRASRAPITEPGLAQPVTLRNVEQQASDERRSG